MYKFFSNTHSIWKTTAYVS